MKREDQSPENIDEHYKKHLIEPHKHDQTPRQTSILPPADPLPGCCRSCLFYSFCCCCACCRMKVPTRRENWMQRFSRWIKVSSVLSSQDKKLVAKDGQPFQILIRLYAHEKCVEDLKECRLNPDFTNLHGSLRNDLEFYIPQIVSFLLFGNYEENQTLLKFILLACSTSFYFSHLVWFNFQSYIGDDTDPETYEKQDPAKLRIKTVMKAIKEVCENSKERLYLANSSEIVDLIKQLHLGSYYPYLNAAPPERTTMMIPKLDHSKKRYPAPTLFQTGERRHSIRATLKYLTDRAVNLESLQQQKQRIDKVNGIIKEYNEMGDKKWNSSDSDYFARNDLVITARDIILNRPFGSGDIEPYTLLDSEGNEEQVQNTNVQPHQSEVDSYLSTPRFLKYLTDLSWTISDLPPPDRPAAVEQSMMNLNKHLPSPIYIPFINQSYRNYALLHVLPKECKVFKTKERCPYLITLELFRPQEMSLSPSIGVKVPLVREMRLAREAEQIMEERKFRHTVASGGSNELAQQDITEQKREKQQKIEKKRDELNKRMDLSASKKKKRAPRESIVNIADECVSKQLTIQNATIEIQEDYFSAGAHRGTDARTLSIFKKAQEESIQEVAEESHQKEEDETDRQEEEKKNVESILFMLLDKKSPRFSENLRHSSSLDNVAKQLSPSKFGRKTTELEEAGNKQEREVATGADTDPGLELSQRSDTAFINSQDSETKIEIIRASDQEDKRDDSKEFYTEERRRSARLDSVYEGYNKNDIKEIERKSTLHNNESFTTNKTVFPRNFLFSETAEEQELRIRKASPYGSLQSWKLLRMIIKCGDDIRQEQFAIQLIAQIQHIFNLKRLRLWMFPYEILSTGPGVGIVEVVSDALSIDGIKKSLPADMSTLMDYFRYNFGESSMSTFKRARDAFAESLAAYSLVSYILQIKDRHNANLLIDKYGHIVHIDFGFLLSNAPGKGIRFESAPFKLTNEFVEILGGVKSRTFLYFRDLMIDGFQALQEFGDRVLVLVEMMLIGNQDMPCFQNKERTLTDLKERIYPLRTEQGQYRRMNRAECGKHIDYLINQSNDNWRTNMYDKFQYCCQGIF